MSVAGNVADAVVAAVGALALTGVTVARRKTPSLPPGKNPPAVVVTVADEGESEPMTGRKDFVRYPVGVTIITAGGSALADNETIRLWRGQIRAAVNTPDAFAGVSQFNEVTPAGRTPFDPAALARDLNYSTLTFTVECIEDRN